MLESFNAAMASPSAPENIFWAVLVFSWVEYLWSAYLSTRQRGVLRTHTSVPAELAGVMDANTFEKARTYALDKSRFGTVQGIFSHAVSTLIMWFYGLKVFWDVAGSVCAKSGLDPASHDITHSVAFISIFSLFNTIIGLPFTVYDTFVLEEKHGFNKQTTGFFIKDQIKKFIIGQAIMLPMVAVIIQIIQAGGDYFFVYLWLFVTAFTFFMMIIYPEFIAPLFDRYVPLPEGDLRKQIEELASSIEFPLYKLYVVEGSKRSAHSNAYFYGFFRFKRIVLFDTLLEKSERDKIKTEEELKKEEEEAKKEETEEKDGKKGKGEPKGCTSPEILAVLGHELGHWKLNHVAKNMAIAETQIFLMFALFAALYHHQALYSAFGFMSERPTLIGFIIILQFVTAPYNALLDFLMTCLSRRFEFAADEFAVGLGRGEHLAAALVKLNNDNLSFPIYDWLYSAFHHSHPPLLERMKAITANNKSKKEN